jgi:hypothetical protein
MKRFIIASLLAASVTAVSAAPFDYQRQIGSSEYVHGADTAGMHFAPVAQSNFVPSLTRWMLGANVDGIAANDFRGSISPSGPTRISLYEFQRGSPEATANRGYYERFPANTDWDRVAREFREQQRDKGLASGHERGPDAS